MDDRFRPLSTHVHYVVNIRRDISDGTKMAFVEDPIMPDSCDFLVEMQMLNHGVKFLHIVAMAMSDLAARNERDYSSRLLTIHAFTQIGPYCLLFGP